MNLKYQKFIGNNMALTQRHSEQVKLKHVILKYFPDI